MSFFITGATLGLVAGITPGPLLTLVITETMKYNRKEGMKIALAPVLSDLPIVTLSLLILAKMSSYDNILGIISFLGSGFLIYMAYETIKIKSTQLNIESTETHSFKKGILANAKIQLVSATISFQSLKSRLCLFLDFIYESSLKRNV